jgi:hypothetical protein
MGDLVVDGGGRDEPPIPQKQTEEGKDLVQKQQ